MIATQVAAAFAKDHMHAADSICTTLLTVHTHKVAKENLNFGNQMATRICLGLKKKSLSSLHSIAQQQQ